MLLRKKPQLAVPKRGIGNGLTSPVIRAETSSVYMLTRVRTRSPRVNNRRKLPALHLKASLAFGISYHYGPAFKARSGVIGLDSHSISSVWQAVVELITADKWLVFEDSVTGQALPRS